MPAQKELLGDLHSAIAADLLQRVQSGEATSAELSTAITGGYARTLTYSILLDSEL